MTKIRFLTFKQYMLVLGVAMTILNFSACSQEETANDTGVMTQFDQQAWKAMQGSQVADNPRARMVKDLKANHLKIGMTRAEVETILGEADRTRNGQYLYRLGMGRYSADYSYLALLYDDTGRLTAILDTRS